MVVYSKFKALIVRGGAGRSVEASWPNTGCRHLRGPCLALPFAGGWLALLVGRAVANTCALAAALVAAARLVGSHVTFPTRTGARRRGGGRGGRRRGRRWGRRWCRAILPGGGKVLEERGAARVGKAKIDIPCAGAQQPVTELLV